jgi:hypothetical protein
MMTSFMHDAAVALELACSLRGEALIVSKQALSIPMSSSGRREKVASKTQGSPLLFLKSFFSLQSIKVLPLRCSERNRLR